MNIKKRLYSLLVLGILAPVCLAGGIPLIVFSAINGWWIAMSLGIVMVLFGFYGTPLLWVNYGKTRSQYILWLLITQDHILTVTELASALGKKTRYIQNGIHLLISRRCLVGYKFVGQSELVTTQPVSSDTAKTPSRTINKCINCGAQLVDSGDKYTCTYCGSCYNK